MAHTSHQSYADHINASWKILWTKPAAFAVMAYSYLLMLLFSYLFSSLGEQIFGENILLDPGNITGLLLFALGAFIVLFFFIGHLTAMQIAVYSQLVQNRKVGLLKAFGLSARYFWRTVGVIWLQIAIILVIIGIPYIIILGLFGWGNIISIIIAILLALFMVLLVILVAVWTIFAEPMVAGTKLGVGAIYKKSWVLMKKQAGVMWSTFGIHIGLTIAMTIVIIIVAAIIVLLKLELVSNVISGILQAIVTAWLTIFIYRVYFDKIYHVRD